MRRHFTRGAQMSRFGFCLSIFLAAIPFAVVQAAQAIPSYVMAAVADPARGKDIEADARRHPTELATFAQIKPGDIVVDLIPGGGYFTRIFSQIVGPKGHVYAVWPNEYAKEDSDELPLTQALVKDPHYANVTLLFQPASQFSIPVKADVVWTSQNYHDYPDPFMGPTDPNLLNAGVFAALKPGGVFIVVDHVAEAGSGLRDTNTLHRIDPAMVKAQVPTAGFVFDAESDVLRNPTDDHKLKVFDKKIRGHTDQFVFRYRKPS
jgi:predicted methyltransferase